MAGIYIHIPFCIQKCLYCDFYSMTRLSDIPAFIDALKNEISLKSTAINTTSEETDIFDTIYFGGGTPSVLSPAQLTEIKDHLYTHFHFTDAPEITIEVNPGTVDENWFKTLFKSGINRLSIGIQSFDDQVLAFLQRIHTSKDAHNVVAHARNAGFTNIGFDIISGIPGQSSTDLLQDLDTAIFLLPEHISCYILTCEHNTGLAEKVNTHAIQMPDDEITTRHFMITTETLGKAGYTHYEISNYARGMDRASQHNQKYWNFEPYLGFGPSAHSYDPKKNIRRWNAPDIGAYISALNQQTLPPGAYEILTPEQSLIEAFFLGLRQKKGLRISTVNKIHGIDMCKTYNAVIEHFIKSGELVIRDDRIRLTQKGFLRADGIAEAFINQV